MIGARANHLRKRDGGHARVTFIELFYDLVFVFAVTQLSHRFLEHLTPLGALQAALLMLALWWAWIDTAWVTNWVDPERTAVRVLLFVLMFAGIVFSASMPKAFEERALPFALAYLAMQMGRSLFMLWALRHHDSGNHRNFLRITLWQVAAAPLWIAGALLPSWRLGLWALALVAETISPIVGFRVPGLGRSATTEWQIEGAHLAERCGLFIIIALGESILITGANFAKLDWNAANIAAFVVAFGSSAAMWAVYFNIGAERSSRLVASSDDPGRIGRSGYTYWHIIIVAGVIVTAAADELVLHHPGGHVEPAAAAVILGGPALYLFGNAAFKRLSAPHLPLSHLVGLGLLIALAFAIPFTTPLALSAGTTVVMIVVALWERISLGPNAGQRGTPAH